MARFGQRSCFSASLSPDGEAANPCAKFVHESRARVGPATPSAVLRRRYDARSARLRSLMRSVTSRTRGFSDIDEDIAWLLRNTLRRGRSRMKKSDDVHGSAPTYCGSLTEYPVDAKRPCRTLCRNSITSTWCSLGAPVISPCVNSCRLSTGATLPARLDRHPAFL